MSFSEEKTQSARIAITAAILGMCAGACIVLAGHEFLSQRSEAREDTILPAKPDQFEIPEAQPRPRPKSEFYVR